MNEPMIRPEWREQSIGGEKVRLTQSTELGSKPFDGRWLADWLRKRIRAAAILSPYAALSEAAETRKDVRLAAAREGQHHQVTRSIS